jgi:hypothetical protein
MAAIHPSRWTRWSGGVPEALLFYLVCAQEMERGEHSATGDMVLFVLERFDWRERLDFYAFGRERCHEGAEKLKVRKEKEKGFLCLWEREVLWRSRKARSQEGEGEGFRRNSRNQANSISNQMSNSCIDENLSGKTLPVPSVCRLPACHTTPTAARAWYSIILFSTSQCSRSKFNHISRVNIQSISHTVLNHLPILNWTIEFISFIKY